QRVVAVVTAVAVTAVTVVTPTVAAAVTVGHDGEAAGQVSRGRGLGRRLLRPRVRGLGPDALDDHVVVAQVVVSRRRVRAVDAVAGHSVCTSMRAVGSAGGVLTRGRGALVVDLRARLGAGHSDLEALLCIDEARDLDGVRRDRQRRLTAGLDGRVVAGV